MGMYFAVKNPTNRNVFLVIFGLTTLYFASSMVRLLVLFAPAFALLGVNGSLRNAKAILHFAKGNRNTSFQIQTWSSKE